MEKNKIVSSALLGITESLMHASEMVTNIPLKIRIIFSSVLFIALLFLIGKKIILLIFLLFCAYIIYLSLKSKAIKMYLMTLAPVINGRVLGSCIKQGHLEGVWEEKMVKVILKKDIKISFYYPFSASLSFACRGWWNARPTKQWKIVNIEEDRFTKDFFVLAYDENQAKKFLTKRREEIISRLLTKRITDKLSKFSRSLFIYPECASFNLVGAKLSLHDFSEIIQNLSELTR